MNKVIYLVMPVLCIWGFLLSQQWQVVMDKKKILVLRNQEWVKKRDMLDEIQGFKDSPLIDNLKVWSQLKNDVRVFESVSKGQVLIKTFDPKGEMESFWPKQILMQGVEIQIINLKDSDDIKRALGFITQWVKVWPFEVIEFNGYKENILVKGLLWSNEGGLRNDK